MRRYSYRNYYTWDKDIAYITGLMAADGCLSNDMRHLNITSADKEIIDHFMEVLDLTNKIGTKTSPYGSKSFDLQFGDVSLYDFFQNAGLTPKKSKTLGALNIPEEFYSDFLRGYFDGDGTVYGYWDKRWRSSWMFYTAFTSGSRDFLKWIREQNTNIFGVGSGTLRNGSRAISLAYAKKDSYKLIKNMYPRPDTRCLERKRQKCIEIMQVDQYPG